MLDHRRRCTGSALKVRALWCWCDRGVSHSGARKRAGADGGARKRRREGAGKRAGGVERERERERAPVTLRQTTSTNDLKLTCAVFQMRLSLSVARPQAFMAELAF